MKIVCASTTCKYGSEEEDSSNVIFISFPNDDTAKIWAHNCGRPDLLVKHNEELHLNHYVCSHHMEDEYFISKADPVMITQGAIPTLFGTEITKSADTVPTDIKKLEYQFKSFKSGTHLNKTMHIDEYSHTQIQHDLQNNVIESRLESEKNSAISIFTRTAQMETSDNDALTYCVINAEIDQYHGVTIGFSSLCRICGDEAQDGIEIFTAKGIELGLRDKIGLHMPISVDVEDIMPQRLCIDCCNKLEIAHTLVTTCLQTDMRFRRFLNVEGSPEYDGRFDALVEECCMEVADEINSDEPVQNGNISFVSSNKDEESSHVNGLECELKKCSGTTKLEQIPQIGESHGSNLHKLKFDVNGKDEEIHSDFNDLFHVLKGVKNEDNGLTIESAAETRDLINIKKDGHIICLMCKDTFKTQEMFENHKILCDDEDGLNIKEQEEIHSSISRGELQAAKVLNFQYDSKSCNVCKVIFETEALLREHKLSHCELSQQLNCQTCNQLFANREDLNLHKQLHRHVNETAGPKRRCGYCRAAFHTRKELQNHISESHGGQTLFKCNMCDKSYEKWSSLDVHEATHRLDKPFLCDLCGKSFKHSNNLRGHKRIHLDESKKKRHVCEVCGNAFRSKFHLSEHTNQHNDNKPYTCEQCGKAFYKRIQLRQHKLSHGLNKYACPICSVTFNRRGNMNTHLKRHNSGNGMYTCSVCECKCKSMSELKMHRKQHSERDILESVKKKSVDKTIWQCKVCARVFLKRAVWLNHERTHAGDKITVECNECGKKLASKSSLTYHKKSMHSTDRPHMCQFCGESFVSKEARLIHERIHTGERPYVCKICNMQYRCSSNLSQHMKIHSEARPHVCQYCNKGFTRKGALIVHERIHTGVKPFACVVCGRTFSQKNDMLKHTKTHRIKSIQCERCDEVFATKKEILKHIALHDQSMSELSVIQGYVEVPQSLESYTINIPYSNIKESGKLCIVQNN